MREAETGGQSRLTSLDGKLVVSERFQPPRPNRTTHDARRMTHDAGRSSIHVSQDEVE